MEERLAKLERRCRCQTASLLLIALGAAAVPLMGAMQQAETDSAARDEAEIVPSVITRALAVVDQNNIPRISMFTLDEKVMMAVFGEDGKKVTFSLTSENGNSEMSFRDEDVNRLSITSKKEATVLQLGDSRKKPRIGFVIDEKDNAACFLTDKKGTPVKHPFAQ